AGGARAIPARAAISINGATRTIGWMRTGESHLSTRIITAPEPSERLTRRPTSVGPRPAPTASTGTYDPSIDHHVPATNVAQTATSTPSRRSSLVVSALCRRSKGGYVARAGDIRRATPA